MEWPLAVGGPLLGILPARIPHIRSQYPWQRHFRASSQEKIWSHSAGPFLGCPTFSVPGYPGTQIPGFLNLYSPPMAFIRWQFILYLPFDCFLFAGIAFLRCSLFRPVHHVLFCTGCIFKTHSRHRAIFLGHSGRSGTGQVKGLYIWTIRINYTYKLYI